MSNENYTPFTLQDGRIVINEERSNKLWAILEEHPEMTDTEKPAYEWNELGMSKLFSHLYSDVMCYCVEQKCWYVYQDGKWTKDEGSVIASRNLKEFSRLMMVYAGCIENDEMRGRYYKFTQSLGDRRFRDRILKDSADEMAMSMTAFDRDPYLINCRNGTYDLRTYEFRESNPEDMITMQTAFRGTNDRESLCSRWEQFVTEVTEGDDVKANYLQRALGYSMLGRSNEECMFILHGKKTRNGKSTMLHAIEHMLGDYGTATPVALICKGDRTKDSEAASPEMVRLKGKRFVTMNESNEFGRLDEERIKQLTGGESVTARALYQSPITFVPQFTMWLSCNDLPSVSDRSLFASDRIRLIEFNKHFGAEERDKNLKDNFETDEAMNGIFMWLVRGYRMYVEQGLDMPESMRTPLRQYEKANDLVASFVEERCKFGAELTVKGASLYTAYKNWCVAGGLKPVSMRRFNSEMDKHPDWEVYCTFPARERVYHGLGFAV